MGDVADDPALVVAPRGQVLRHVHDVPVGVQIAFLGLHGTGAALERRQHLHADRQVVRVGQLVEVAPHQVGPRPADDLAPGRVRLLPASVPVQDHDPEGRLVEGRGEVEAEQLQAGAARFGPGGGGGLVTVRRHRRLHRRPGPGSPSPRWRICTLRSRP